MILQTALSIVDSDGVDRSSMCRLSDALGRDPVMLYPPRPNKAAVLDGVAEIVLAQLPVDNTDPDCRREVPLHSEIIGQQCIQQRCQLHLLTVLTAPRMGRVLEF